MPVLSRTRLAAVCAALSTAAVVGMAAVAVLAGDRSCDLSGCAPVAAFAVSTAVHVTPVEPTCTDPSTTPPTAPAAAATRPEPGPCDDGGQDATGGTATVRVPAP